jgi:hypothetical protein
LAAAMTSTQTSTRMFSAIFFSAATRSDGSRAQASSLVKTAMRPSRAHTLLCDKLSRRRR